MNAENLASVDMERGVLGEALWVKEDADAILSMLKPDDFWNPECQRIFEAIGVLRSEGKPCDAISVADQLKDVPVAQLLGYRSDAYSLGSETYYCSQIRRYAYKRRLRDELLTALSGKDIDPEILQMRVEVLCGSVDRGETTITIGDIIHLSVDRLRMIISTGKAPRVIPTPWSRLNDVIGGARPGEVVIIAARPGVGKSALALSWAFGAAQAGNRVNFVSLEMNNEQIGTRFLSALSGVAGDKINSGKYLSKDEMARIERHQNELQGVPLNFESMPRCKISELARLAEKDALLVVDYIQLIQPESRKIPREQQVAQISRDLKILAHSRECAIVIVAQANRAADQRKNSAPKLSDLRESGSLENDADTVIMLHRPKWGKDDEPDPSPMTVYIRKQRSGPTGKVEMMYDRSRQRITERAFDDGWHVPDSGREG